MKNSDLFNVSDEAKDTFRFCADGEEPLVLTKEGFYYLGEIVSDKGDAYRLFNEFLNKSVSN